MPLSLAPHPGINVGLSLQDEIIGIEIFRSFAFYAFNFGSTQARLNCAEYIQGDLVLKRENVIERTIDRKPLWLAQTPQAFRRDWLEEAHRKAQAEGMAATDDAYLLEWMGRPVRVIEGSGENIKVTRPEDLVIGEAILASRTDRRP